MKIEFEISKKNVILLINSLRYALGATSNPANRVKLQKIIDEVIKDAKVSEEIIRQLKFFLQNSKGVNPERLKSKVKLKDILPINYLQQMGGLEAVCNNILMNIKNAFKPGAKTYRIPLYKVKDCKVVGDVTKLIQDAFESI